ncbi:MAG: hypothetical protein GY760_07690 [Deltaproteobacteria bacterium]|nr:hypothetical protein [Deltaproteobacteria bacterium]
MNYLKGLLLLLFTILLLGCGGSDEVNNNNNNPNQNPNPDLKLIITDNFESGDLKTLNWTNSTDNLWFVSEEKPKSGTSSLKSPLMGDKNKSALEISMYCQEGAISFWYKVSSEEDFDFLKFYIDGELQKSWSGEVPYTQANFNVSKGRHSFKWVYTKDGSNCEGDDVAWIDEIVFPGSLDSDFDGMPNSWEIENKLIYNVNDALDDADGDGFCNYAEYVAGSDPDNSNDIPLFTDKKEDFETGGFSIPFEISGEGIWKVVDSEGFDSTKGFKVPPLSDNQSAVLKTKIYCESGTVSFRVAVNSKEGFDYLNFYIDGELKGRWCGEVPFTQVSYPVDSGMHTFKWRYSNAIANSNESDTAWLDDITFPGSVDSDNDKMPDAWEIANNLNPLFKDANVDSDNDGFKNIHEYLGNTDPNVINTTVDYTLPVAIARVLNPVIAGKKVTLDGSLSSDVGGILTYKWKQISGLDVELSNKTNVNPTFVAPPLSEKDPLVFELTVEDFGGVTDVCKYKIRYSVIESEIKKEEIRSSQEWIVPEGVTQLTVTLVAGGKEGGNPFNKYIGPGLELVPHNGRGGNAGQTVIETVSVTPGETISIIIGESNTDSLFGTYIVSKSGEGAEGEPAKERYVSSGGIGFRILRDNGYWYSYGDGGRGGYISNSNNELRPKMPGSKGICVIEYRILTYN